MRGRRGRWRPATPARTSSAPSARKPGFSRWSFSRLLTISPAPITSISASATSATTSTRLAPRPPPLVAPRAPVSRRLSLGSVRNPRRAGARPNSDPGQHRNREREGKHPRVDRDRLDGVRNPAGAIAHEQPHEPAREQHADGRRPSSRAGRSRSAAAGRCASGRRPSRSESPARADGGRCSRAAGSPRSRRRRAARTPTAPCSTSSARRFVVTMISCSGHTFTSRWMLFARLYASDTLDRSL